MITFMSNPYEFIKDTIVITNRTLVKGDYLSQIRKVAALHPAAMILREKDLSDDEYEKLAANVLEICRQEDVDCYLHSHVEIARKLSCRKIHVPVSYLPELEKYPDDWEGISVSCHSVEDVKKAISCGASKIVLGTIFETDCKPGLEGKGLEFVRMICEHCPEILVYAIGGIHPDNLQLVKEAGARGGCMMSYMMTLE